MGMFLVKLCVSNIFVYAKQYFDLNAVKKIFIYNLGIEMEIKFYIQYVHIILKTAY